jgi:hypothetical protein
MQPLSKTLAELPLNSRVMIERKGDFLEITASHGRVDSGTLRLITIVIVDREIQCSTQDVLAKEIGRVVKKVTSPMAAG